MSFGFPARSARKIAAIIGLLAFCLIAGCSERTTDGSTSIYRYPWWVGPAVIAGGILTVPIGWAIRKAIPRFGAGLMWVGPVVLLVIAPAMYSDHVLVDDDHFEATYGFWFHPTVQNVQFGDLREIQFIGVPRGLGRINHEIRCVAGTGQVTVVSGGDLVIQSVPEILIRAGAKKVRIVNTVP